MTTTIAITMLVVGTLMIGLLLGSSWTVEALRSTLRRQAGERRRLNEEWSAIRTARRQRSECPRCASPLSESEWYFAPKLVSDRLDDDD